MVKLKFLKQQLQQQLQQNIIHYMAKTKIGKENISVLPLNINLNSSKLQKNIKGTKNDIVIDKDKENKIMEKINEKFQQSRNATRLNNGICQFLIIKSS